MNKLYDNAQNCLKKQKIIWHSQNHKYTQKCSILFNNAEKLLYNFNTKNCFRQCTKLWDSCKYAFAFYNLQNCFIMPKLLVLTSIVVFEIAWQNCSSMYKTVQNVQHSLKKYESVRHPPPHKLSLKYINIYLRALSPSCTSARGRPAYSRRSCSCRPGLCGTSFAANGLAVLQGDLCLFP